MEDKMNKWFCVLTGVLLLLALGCSSGDSPVMPNENSQDPQLADPLRQSSDSGSARILWGYYTVTIDGGKNEVDIFPLRSAMFNANVTHFLSPPYTPVSCLTISLLPDCDFPNGYVNVDVTLKHPFQGTNMYRGFDVRGIFMADGSIPGAHDPDIIYGLASINEAELLNEDGYSRWWNSTEFTDPLELLSYTQGPLGSLPFPSATLNPYKYFADDIAYEGTPADLPVENRGVFSPDVSGHTRNYKIQFPVDGGPLIDFNYAVDASWELPDDSYAPEYPVEAFPPGAQVQEPYYIEIDTSESTVWEINGEHGGSIIAKLEIFDWQADGSPEGVPGQIKSIWAESPLFTAPINLMPLAAVSDGSTTTSSVYEVEITGPDLSIPSVGNFPILITVESMSPDSYMPQIEGGEIFIYPDGPLAAYAMSQIEVVPGDPPVIQVTAPNGGELWNVGSSQEITWTGGVGIPLVNIDYSKDNFVSDINSIVSSTDNDGSFTWDPIPDDPSTTVKIRVSDAADPLIFDYSDNYFSILGIEFELLVPNGGESWIIWSIHDIEWTGGIGVTDVTLTYSKDDFASDINVIAAGVPNNGTYEWNPIPDDPSTTVKVRVEDAADPALFDDSDDYFTITDACIFTDSHTYDAYTDVGAVVATGFHYMRVDEGKVVACRPEDGMQDSYPWIAVYDESDMFTPLDQWKIPDHEYPERPFDFDIDSNDRIFFFVDDDNYDIGYRGPEYTELHYVDWTGSVIDDASHTTIDLTPFLDTGEMCVEQDVSDDDVYILTDQGKIIKLDHTADYAGEVFIDLDGSPDYPDSMELDFLLASDANVFFIYTDDGAYKRAIWKISMSGEVLDSARDIFSGIVSCGTSTGGIGNDGDCRLLIVDGHAMGGWVCMRYDYDLGQSAYSMTPEYEIMNHPGNAMHIKSDGYMVFNSYFWQDKSYLVSWTPPADW